MSLTIKTYPYGPLQENTYLVIDDNSGYKAVIDPGYYGRDVIADIGDMDSLKYIFLTHGHFDHVYASQDYKDNFPNAMLIAPDKERYLISKDWATDPEAMGLPMKKCAEPDQFIKNNESIKLGDTEFTFFDTPGHTEGGMCILADGKLFSGDTLFRLSVGNTTFETGDWNTLKESIKNVLYALDEDVTVYPGHGPATTIGLEMRANPYVQVLY